MTTIATVMKIDDEAARKRKPSIRRSLRLKRRRKTGGGDSATMSGSSAAREIEKKIGAGAMPAPFWSRRLGDGLFLQDRVDRQADFRHATEPGSDLALVDALEADFVGVVGQRHVLDFLDQGARFLAQEVGHELLHDRLLVQGFLLHIDEEGPRQRLIL